MPASARRAKTRFTVKPVRRDERGLVDRVADDLADMIVNGRLAEGQTLPPAADLEQMYGVSRTVIREAMQVLAVRGMVEITHGRRMRVAAVSSAPVIESLQTLVERLGGDLLQLTEARQPIEGEIAALATQRATDTDIEALQALIDHQQSCRTIDAQVEADIAFHNKLAETAGNAVLQAMMTAVVDLLFEARRRTISRTGNKRALEGHRYVLQAVRDKDSDAARKAMAEHLKLARLDLSATNSRKHRKGGKTG